MAADSFSISFNAVKLFPLNVTTSLSWQNISMQEQRDHSVSMFSFFMCAPQNHPHPQGKAPGVIEGLLGPDAEGRLRRPREQMKLRGRGSPCDLSMSDETGIKARNTV